MKKILAILAGVLLLATAVFAFGPHHEELEEINSYSELEEYREANNLNVLPWIVDEESFELWEEKHSFMEQWRARVQQWADDNGIEHSQGYQRGYGRGFGCPMH